MTSKGKKRRKRQGKRPKRTKSDLEPNQGVIAARSDDVGPSDQLREPSLEPKHKIFLSHSGAQKDFTWQLCTDLEREHHFPFFDRREDSLPKGEKFPPLIMDAAKRCRVAVLVLSDEFFTRSKWPMIELNEFGKAQGSNNPGLKILPLFLGITMKQFHEKKRRARWFTKWKELAREDCRIDVEEWKVALSKIPGGINAMEYNGAGEGEVAFRKKVVAAVCKLLPPDLKYDVSHVQSLERLCEPIKKRLEEVEVSMELKVRVVGLYGMGGVGKTTISKAICNQMFAKFSGKVCHVELGGNDPIELRRKVLRELTEASSTILNNDSDKLADLLKQRMHRQKVFLVLDNVWDDQIEEAHRYLNVGFLDGSMVMVTSRSLEVLRRLHIQECNCMEMPNLEEEGAIDVFLHYTRISKEIIVDSNKWKIVQRCVKECCFSSGEIATPSWSTKRTYHPLALKVLGGQLGSMGLDIGKWDETLTKLEVDKFNMLKENKHPVFCVLRLGFDALEEEQQHIFLDLALVWASKLARFAYIQNVRFEWEWLCKAHTKSEAEMIQIVKALQRKGLLDKMKDITKLECNIHDLYFEFAEAEARAGPFEKRWILLDKDGTDVPQELVKYPSNGVSWASLRRLSIHYSKIKSLKNAVLQFCKNVEVVDLYECWNLEEVDVTGMDNLRFLVVRGCTNLAKWVGLETLNNLVAFCWVQDSTYLYVCPRNVLTFSSRALQVVKLYGILWHEGLSFPVDLRCCTNLKEVCIDEVSALLSTWDRSAAPIDLRKCLPISVMKVGVRNSRLLVSSPITSMAAFTNLQDLNLRGCNMVEDLTGLCELISLEKLDARETGISEMPPNMCNLKHLQFLDVSYCGKLTSILSIAPATTLRHVIACGCPRLREVPGDLSGLEKLELLDLRDDVQICTLPKDYGRSGGYPGSEGILKMRLEGCWGLIVPLVEKLREPEASEVICADECRCGGESMQSWIDARKRIDGAAYDMLRDVLLEEGHWLRTKSQYWPFWSGYWSYLLDDGGVVDFVIRALCEHDARWGRSTNRLANVVSGVILSNDYVDEGNFNMWGDWICKPRWWVVVATAQCTFKVLTERAMVVPWRKTLLHYTIVSILPQFLILRASMVQQHIGHCEDESHRSHESLLYKGIVAVLQKCEEKLENASENSDLVHTAMGKDFVKTFLREIIAAKDKILLESNSILNLGGKWDYHGYDETGRRYFYYKDFFPNYQFEHNFGEEYITLEKNGFNLSSDDEASEEDEEGGGG